MGTAHIRPAANGRCTGTARAKHPIQQSGSARYRCSADRSQWLRTHKKRIKYNDWPSQNGLISKRRAFIVHLARRTPALAITWNVFVSVSENSVQAQCTHISWNANNYATIGQLFGNKFTYLVLETSVKSQRLRSSH